MAQNITLEDILREIEVVFRMEEVQGHEVDLTCQSRMGLTRCNRHHLHHGKHAAGTLWRKRFTGGYYFPTKVVRWR